MDDENAGSYPAFPVVSADHVYASGMSLRDWFAGQALTGLVTGRSANTMTFAKEAYAIADAMLRVRGVTTPNTTAKETGND